MYIKTSRLGLNMRGRILLFVMACVGLYAQGISMGANVGAIGPQSLTDSCYAHAASGNLTTDDTTACQAAINAVGATGGGGTVIFYNNYIAGVLTYPVGHGWITLQQNKALKLGSTLTINGFIRLVGEGGPSQGVQFQREPPTPIYCPSAPSDCILVTGTSANSIANISISTLANQNGIHAYNGANLDIYNIGVTSIGTSSASIPLLIDSFFWLTGSKLAFNTGNGQGNPVVINNTVMSGPYTSGLIKITDSTMSGRCLSIESTTPASQGVMGVYYFDWVVLESSRGGGFLCIDDTTTTVYNIRLSAILMADVPSSTLTGNISSGVSTIPVGNFTNNAIPDLPVVFQIDAEQLSCSAGAPAGNYTCSRGYNGTTPATHSTGTAIALLLPLIHIISNGMFNVNNVQVENSTIFSSSVSDGQINNLTVNGNLTYNAAPPASQVVGGQKLTGLPTSCSGLATGTIWNNSGALGICP
jgi:hypothetical protein